MLSTVFNDYDEVDEELDKRSKELEYRAKMMGMPQRELDEKRVDLAMWALEQTYLVYKNKKEHSFH